MQSAVEASGNESESATPPPGLAFLRCIDRIESLIATETQILKSGAAVDFDMLNLRKSHALMELLQVTRSAPEGTLSLTQGRVERLRELLAVNAEALQQHLLAIRAINELIVECVRREESDGTYSIKNLGRR